jgi:hypothetical protein
MICNVCSSKPSLNLLVCCKHNDERNECLIRNIATKIQYSTVRRCNFEKHIVVDSLAEFVVKSFWKIQTTKISKKRRRAHETSLSRMKNAHRILNRKLRHGKIWKLKAYAGRLQYDELLWLR